MIIVSHCKWNGRLEKNLNYEEKDEMKRGQIGSVVNVFKIFSNHLSMNQQLTFTTISGICQLHA